MGYNKGGGLNTGKKLTKLSNTLTKNDCIIWCTDNNGQISNDSENTTDKNIGNWSYSDKN